MSMTIEVIIPTWKPGKELEELIRRLMRQRVRPHRIHIVNTDESCWDPGISDRWPGIALTHIEKREFDHGGTRDMAARESQAEVLVFMTQDAMPANELFLGHLIAPLLQDPSIAMSGGRQLPKADASPMERLVREFNYPDQSRIRSAEDLPELGIKTFFISDVCCAYRRETYLSLGGFDYPLKTNEDMFFAAKAIRAGYQIVYAAEAEVIHSHNLSFTDQYRRNKLQGYELARHRELLGDDSPVASGKEMFMYVMRGLLKQGHVISWIGFGVDCVARYTGNRAGKREYEKKIEWGRELSKRTKAL